MGDLKITGTQQFVQLAKALNAQGKGGRRLKRELMSAIKEAAKPMEDEVRRHTHEYLPSGYAPIVSTGLTVRPSQKTTGSAVGLKLVGFVKGRPRKRYVANLDRGSLRHPVYGNREEWVEQGVKPGFWREPLLRARDIPATKIRRAVQDVLRKLT